MNHVFIVVLMAVVLTLGLNIYDHEIAKLATSAEQSMLLVALELLIVAYILYGVTKGIAPMASSLAGGIAMAALGWRGAVDTAKGTGQTIKSVGKAVSSPVAGAYNAGKWMTGKLDSGNSVSNSSGSSQPELGFRQTVRKHLYGKAAND